MNTMKKTYRIGCIGTGYVVNSAHLQAYLSSGDVKLVALFDIDREAAEKTREHYLSLLSENTLAHDECTSDMQNVEICETVEELLQKVDIVDVCTNVRWHAYYSAMALERNIHVMTEKPMARTWWEANRVAETAAKSTAIFQLNDDNVFIPRYQTLKNIVESGMIGDVQNVWIARGYPGSGRALWFWQPIENGGGCIMDYGSHAVASTWFIIGYDKVPVEVRSLGIQVKNRTRFIAGKLREIERDDDAHFKIRYRDPKNGDWINVTIESTWSWPDFGRDGSDVHGYIEVVGSTGTVTGYFDEQGEEYFKIKHRTFGDLLIPVKSISSEDQSFQDEIQNFITCIKDGTKSVLNADIGAKVIAILNSAQLSELRSRKSITLDEMEAFSRETAAGAPDPWAAGDRIINALAEPYKW